MAAAPMLRCGRLLATVALLLAVAGIRAEHTDAQGIPPPPSLPERFQISFYASDTQSSPFENQGTQVTLARDGHYIGLHYDYADSSVYYDLRCTAGDTAVSSVQVSWFNIMDRQSGEPLSQKQCWYAQAGTQMKEGQWHTVREIITAWISQPPSGWEFGGYLRNYDIRMHLWSRMASRKARHEITYNTGTGEPMTMVIGQEGYLHIWSFIANSTIMYAEGQEVPRARPPALDDCVLTTDKLNFQACPTPSQRRAMQAATGESAYAPNWRQLEAVLGGTSNGGVPYTGAGRYKTEYRVVSQEGQLPEVFYPPNANKDKPDVRNQRNCGSCWAFATASSLSSIYSNKHGVHYNFSPQYLADCVPKNRADDTGTGCWGSSSQAALDFLITSGSVLPLDQDYPYDGVQGKCRTETQGVHLNVTGYAVLTSVAEAKDAIVNYGALAVSVDAGDAEFDAYGESGKAITLDKLSEGGARGISCTSTNTNHAVIVIGWTKCMLKNSNFGYSEGECWIMQNSWGASMGTDGLWLIDMTPGKDCGISTDLVLPILA